MTRLRRNLMFLGVAMTTMAPLIAESPLWIQQAIMLLFISVLGIPHGALDHFVHMGNASALQNKGMRKALPAFFGGYLLTMASYAVLWWISPLTGFLLFLAISAVHFAETDLLEASGVDRGANLMEHGFYGVLILSFLFIPHLSDVKAILSTWPALSSALDPLDDFGHMLPLIPWILLGAWSVGQVLLKRGSSLGILIQTWILACTVHVLPLLPAFTFYFALWHSSISLQAIHKHLNRERSCTARQMIMKALPLSLLSLSAIGALLWFGLMELDFPRLLMGTLISISVLTLPHMAIMNTMHRKMSRLKQRDTDPARLPSTANTKS